MKTLRAILVIFCLLFIHELWAIQEFDIRLKVDNIECQSRQVCYLVQLRSPNGQGWNLAGQNYRLFYDASVASYINGSATSLLSNTRYSNVLLTADIQNVDASAFDGDLKFENTLSFLNYSIDLMNLSNGGVNLPANGDWVNTSKLCFEVSQELIDNPSRCFEAVWARMGRTDGYATAFIEVSQWLSTNSTTAALGKVFDDLDATDGAGSCITSSCGGDENENTDPSCSDGIDNDKDGLVDCADPDCANSQVCVPETKTFDIRLDLKSIDCVTRQACYNVQLKAKSKKFTLGSQRYRLFYGSAIGKFISGVSRLPGATFQPFTLAAGSPLENNNATGLGALPYESNLGFIDFSLLLTNQNTGSTTMVDSINYTTTAELCFEVSASAINNNNTCFQANWARTGLTTAYNQSVLDLKEWVAANQTRNLVGIGFEDLTPSNGNKSCFNTSCGSDETGEPQCSDGIDNDNDGLVDCLDPGCSTTNKCQSNCSANAPTLSGK